MASQGAGGENFGAESAVAFQGNFGAGSEGVIHPVAGFTFFGAEEADALEFKFLADEGIEIEAGGDDVTAIDGGGRAGLVELVTDAVVDGEVEEGDLAFEISAFAEVAVADETLAGDAFGGVHFDNRVLAGWGAVVAAEVVAGRDEDVLNGGHVIFPKHR